MKKNLKKVMVFGLIAVSFWVMLDYGLPQVEETNQTHIEQMMNQEIR